MASPNSEDLVVYDEESRADVSNHRLGMAIAHVSAQTQDIAECQLQLHTSQQLQAQQQQLYTESRVQQARDEAEQRTLALAEMIRSTQIDPTAIEQHVNTQLQSTIAAANDVAQAQAHVADVRMTETIQRLQEQLYASMEQCVQDVLKAHVEQVSAEIRLTVAAQCREILKGVEEQINAIKTDTTTAMEQTKTAAEKKAKSIVRRHYAEENAAHEKIEARLLQSFEDYKQTTVATALLRVDELLRAFVSQQTVKVIDVKSQAVAQHGSSAVRDKRSGGEDNAIDRTTSSMPPAIVATSMSLDEEKEMHISNVHVGKLNGSNRAKLSEDAQELHKLMRYPKPTCEQDIKLSIDLQSVRRSEQQKVVARALARSRGLKPILRSPVHYQKQAHEDFHSRRQPVERTRSLASLKREKQ